MKIGSTKREIIVALKERSKTVSELSRELKLAKPSIYKHLIILKSYGVVERMTNGNRFVYYRLTEKGRKVLDLVLSVVISTLSSILAYVFAQGFQDFQDVQVKQVRYAGGMLPQPIPTPLISHFPHSPSYSKSPTMAAILAFIFIFIITFFSFKLYRDYRINNKI